MSCNNLYNSKSNYRLFAQFLTYPLDVIRRRMQILQKNTSSQYNYTTIQLLKTLYETEGIRGLTKGFSLNIIKGPITLSLSLTTYDILQKWINKDITFFFERK